MGRMPCDASALLLALQGRALETNDRDELGRVLVAKIRETVPRARWAGIYWCEPDALVLGPYDGPATSHVRLGAGAGLCGRAVAEDRDIVVDDVRQDAGVTACSPDVRSEVAVRIRSMGSVVGVLAIDAVAVAAFGEVDRCILKAVADSFGGLLAVAEAPEGR